MIKANELRIGNWVSDPDRALLDQNHGYRQITDIKSNGWCHHAYKNGHSGNKYEYLESIKLTDEIFDKAGFETTKGFYWHPKMTLCIKKGSGDFWLVKSQNHDPITAIQFVHQLQNLFLDVTGEELNIEL